VLEFDPFFAPDSTVDEDAPSSSPTTSASEALREQSVPLSDRRDGEKTPRAGMLIRDQPTSYEGHFPGCYDAFEICSTTGNTRLGQEQADEVLHRVMLHRTNSANDLAWTQARRHRVKQSPSLVALSDARDDGRRGQGTEAVLNSHLGIDRESPFW